jgi:hypothetical protein
MPRLRKARAGQVDPGDAAEAVFTVPDFGGLDDLGAAVLVLLAVVVVVIVIVPLLLFGIELVLLGLLVATGIVGRTLLGRPWIIHAWSPTAQAGDLSWRVVGWRRSNRVIDEVATALRAGLDPSPAEASVARPTAQPPRVVRGQ